MLDASFCGIIHTIPMLLMKTYNPQLHHALNKESLLMSIMHTIHCL